MCNVQLLEQIFLSSLDDNSASQCTHNYVKAKLYQETNIFFIFFYFFRIGIREYNNIELQNVMVLEHVLKKEALILKLVEINEMSWFM
jgi:hypothetical protein